MAGEAEVEDLGVAVLREEDVLGLEVAVDDPLLVGGGEALGDLLAIPRAAVAGNGAADDQRAEGLALEQLCARVDSPGSSDVEEGEDVGVRERGDGLRLPRTAQARPSLARWSGETLTATSRPSRGSARARPLPSPPRRAGLESHMARGAFPGRVPPFRLLGPLQ